MSESERGVSSESDWSFLRPVGPGEAVSESAGQLGFKIWPAFDTFHANRVLLAIPGLGRDPSFLERDGRAEEEDGTPQSQRCLIQSTRRSHPPAGLKGSAF